MYVGRINFRLTLRAAPVLAVCMALASCFQMSSLTTPPAPKYDVRSAVVVSGPGIPPALLTAVGDRVNAAIASTIPNEALPHVVLTVRITHVMKAAGFQGDRNTASVNIDASSVDSGSVVAVAAFETTTFSTDATIIDDLMAEDIAARIRSTFLLTTPRLDSSS
jgi:hypothetical protein